MIRGNRHADPGDYSVDRQTFGLHLLGALLDETVKAELHQGRVNRNPADASLRFNVFGVTAAKVAAAIFADIEIGDRI